MTFGFVCSLYCGYMKRCECDDLHREVSKLTYDLKDENTRHLECIQKYNKLKEDIDARLREC